MCLRKSILCTRERKGKERKKEDKIKGGKKRIDEWLANVGLRFFDNYRLSEFFCNPTISGISWQDFIQASVL